MQPLRGVIRSHLETQGDSGRAYPLVMVRRRETGSSQGPFVDEENQGLGVAGD